MFDTAFMRDRIGLRSLADEQLGDDGESLRVIYGPTFHAWVAITLRRVGELAELEVLVEGAAPEREVLSAADCVAPLDLLRRPIDARDSLTRDGIAAHGERWDGRERIQADIDNPTRTGAPEAHRLLVELLRFTAARPWRSTTLAAFAGVRGYLEDEDEPRDRPRRR